MKISTYLSAVIFSCLVTGPVIVRGQYSTQHDPGSPKVKKAVFIIIDGLSADMIEQNPTPHLDTIAARGGYTRAYVGGRKGGYSETPTISAVGYNSLLTGTWANKHNVWGNSIKAPNYHYPTIFNLYKKQYPAGKTAIFSTWQDNRTKLIGEGLPETGYIKPDYAYDGFELDTIHFPHDPDKKYIRDIDEHIAAEAARHITSDAPDLSWVYLQYTDDIGHRYGDGPRLAEALAFEDRLIGMIGKAITQREKEYGEEWLFIITTDHGRTPEDGKHHGGQSERERSTWIVTNTPHTNAYFREETPAIVDILPTLADFLHIHIPREQACELDGVSLIGKPRAAALKADLNERGQLSVSWKNLTKQDNSTAKIWITETNNYKTGGNDMYRLLGEAPLKEENFLYEPEKPGTFYKIVLETSTNILNTWIIPAK